MGNLCSIFHSKYKKLKSIIPCAKRAQLMDYILLGWQTSTYKLKNSDKKWFMKPHNEMVEETQIKLSTLREYLKEFEEEGFIERRQARYNRKNSHGDYYVTMGGYICITDKFLALIQAEPVNSSTPSATFQPTTESNPQLNEETNTPNSSYFDYNQIIESLNSGESYIRDLRLSFNNNIKFKNLIHSVDNFTLDKLISQFQAIHHYVNNDIKEEIPDEIKKLLLGTFFNLTFEHKKQFSIPEQVVAEYLFSLINTQYCLPSVKDFTHRNSILAKLIRNNQWKTPKGFYNHFYLGQQFKDKMALRDKKLQEEKECELNSTTTPVSDEKHLQLQQIEEELYETSKSMEVLRKSIYEQKTEEQVIIVRSQIKLLENHLETLWGKQRILEEEIELAESLAALKQCA